MVEDNTRLDIGVNAKASELWNRDEFRDTRGVRVGQSRVMRTRPIFPRWKCKAVVMFNDDLVDAESVLLAAKNAGEQCGVGDFRPRFGRFRID